MIYVNPTVAAENNNENTTPVLKNAGQQCWWGCNKNQGPCSWCGSEGMCCRKYWKGNGCDGSIGGGRRHECTKKPEAGKNILFILYHVRF